MPTVEPAVQELSAAEVIGWAANRHAADRLGLACSFQKEEAVLIDLLLQVQPAARIFSLDTGVLFEETYATWKAVEERYGIAVEAYRGERVDGLWATAPDRCCAMRKVEPLARALEPYVAWASGIRRDEAVTRRDAGVVEWDAKRSMVKVNPIATWTQEQADAYVAEHGVLVNPLAYDGYPSIGCAPCTRRVAPGEDPRSGRWAGTGKSECGLHL